MEEQSIMYIFGKKNYGSAMKVKVMIYSQITDKRKVNKRGAIMICLVDKDCVSVRDYLFVLSHVNIDYCCFLIIIYH